MNKLSKESQDWLNKHTEEMTALDGIDNYAAVNAFYVEQKLIKLESKQEWISVEERSPALLQRTITTDTSGRTYNTIWNGEKFKCIGLVWEHDKVTHWMPLPKPPETIEE